MAEFFDDDISGSDDSDLEEIVVPRRKIRRVEDPEVVDLTDEASWEEKDPEGPPGEEADDKKTHKSWLLTVNNPTPRDLEKLKAIEETYNCSIIVIAEESGEAKGTRHYHCFFTGRKPGRFHAIKHMVPRANVMWCRWPAAAEKYVRKGGNIVYEQDTRARGKRSDLEDVGEKIKGGASIRAIAREHPAAFIKYSRGIQALQDILAPRVWKPKYPLSAFGPWEPCDFTRKCVVLVGPTQIGKTQFALAHFPEGALVVSQMDMLKEYNEEVHHAIIFDDMSFAHMPREAQIHILDKEIDRDIWARYTNARIPAQVPKIFTCNSQNIFSEDPAINARLTYVHLRARE
uniref:hypothetical protein n=1 Tax=Shewanella sp. TaxID=50422 RepID=UPI0040480FD2